MREDYRIFEAEEEEQSAIQEAPSDEKMSEEQEMDYMSAMQSKVSKASKATSEEE